VTLLVDTSVWSMALRRDGSCESKEVIALREALGGADAVVTTGLVLQELLQGFSGPKARQAIIDRFGRYPHRNEALGRRSTPEELAFLAQPGSRF